MDKPIFEREDVQGESFQALMEQKLPFFQALQQDGKKEASFKPAPFLKKWGGFEAGSPDKATHSASTQNDKSEQRVEEEEEEKQKQKREALCRLREEIIAAATQEAAKIKEDAYQQGLAQGLAQGREKGKREAAEQIKSRLLPLETTLKNMIWQIEQVQQTILIRQEQEILNLCLEMAKKVICTEISQSRSVLLASLREGLKFVGHHKVVAIRLNPHDLDLLKEVKQEIAHDFLNLDGVSVEADPAVVAGGCLIQTDMGYVDATIDRRVRELEKIFMANGGSLTDQGTGAMGGDDEARSLC